MTSPSNDEKFYKIVYRKSGEVDVESNDMTVFDMWALARYIELQGDRIYISVVAAEETKRKMAENMRPVGATQMPPEPLSLRGPNRNQRRHGN